MAFSPHKLARNIAFFIIFFIFKYSKFEFVRYLICLNISKSDSMDNYDIWGGANFLEALACF